MSNPERKKQKIFLILIRSIRSQFPVCLRIERFRIDPAALLRSIKEFAAAEEKSKKKQNCKREDFHSD